MKLVAAAQLEPIARLCRCHRARAGRVATLRDASPAVGQVDQATIRRPRYPSTRLASPSLLVVTLVLARPR
jgi:hypothetical protein